MHIATVSYFYDQNLATPQALLARYTTLTGVAEGLTRAGARVTVVQRFHLDAEVLWRDVSYRFVREPTFRPGSLVDLAHALTHSVAELRPDVIHVNGIGFARQAARLKRRCPYALLVLQDHANAPPRRAIDRWSMRKALGEADAISFAARELAHPWVAQGFLRDPDKPALLEVMEGSSTFRLLPRSASRGRTGLTGDPLCLWVGRLDENKDPLTVLEGFADASRSLPDARLVMVYGRAEMMPEVASWLDENPFVALRTILLGEQPHAALEAIYNSADLYLLGSHHEGSGFAVLEALSCGVVPVVTDIPTFRSLTGHGAFGSLWPVGAAEELAKEVVLQYRQLDRGTRLRVRAHFEERFSFDAIGRRMLGDYARLMERDRVPSRDTVAPR